MWRIDRLQLAVSKVFLTMPAIRTCLKTPLAGVKQRGRDAKHSTLFSETTSDISMCERQIKDPTIAPGVHVAVSLCSHSSGRQCSTHRKVRKTDCGTDMILTGRLLQTNEMLKNCLKITARNTFQTNWQQVLYTAHTITMRLFEILKDSYAQKKCCQPYDYHSALIATFRSTLHQNRLYRDRLFATIWLRTLTL